MNPVNSSLSFLSCCHARLGAEHFAESKAREPQKPLLKSKKYTHAMISPKASLKKIRKDEEALSPLFDKNRKLGFQENRKTNKTRLTEKENRPSIISKSINGSQFRETELSWIKEDLKTISALISPKSGRQALLFSKKYHSHGEGRKFVINNQSKFSQENVNPNFEEGKAERQTVASSRGHNQKNSTFFGSNEDREESIKLGEANLTIRSFQIEEDDEAAVRIDESVILVDVFNPTESQLSRWRQN